MSLEPRKEDPPPQETPPGTLDLDSERKLMRFPERLADRSMIHWRYLMDDDVVLSFAPHLGPAKRLYLQVKKYNPKVIPTMISNAQIFINDGIKLQGGGARLIGFGQQMVDQVQRSILQYVLNKFRLEVGEKLPKFPLSVFESPDGRLVKIGEGLAPIPDPKSQKALSSIVQGQAVGELNPEELANAKKNLEIVNTLAGTSLSL